MNSDQRELWEKENASPRIFKQFVVELRNDESVTLNSEHYSPICAPEVGQFYLESSMQLSNMSKISFFFGHKFNFTGL